MKVLALDFGAVRVGVALGDTAIGVALPRNFLVSDKNLLAQIETICATEKIGQILVGHPRTLAGGASAQTEKVESFARALATRIDLPVELVDERFTSREAADNLQSSGTKAGAQKELIDSEAARILLQAWLEKTVQKN